MAGHYILILKAVAAFTLLVSDVFASGVQHDQAERTCELNGGLAHHALFSPIPETVSYPPRTDIPGKSYSDLRGIALAEGESAWVSGFAEYSDPLAWYGCAKPMSTGIIVTDQNNSLFHCAQACGYTRNQYEYIGMDGKYCYCFGSNIDNLYASICRKDRQYVGIFHVLSEYCREHFQCYSYRYEPPNTECVKCSAKLKSVCTYSNVNPHITHHCNDTTTNCIIQDTRTWQESGQHCSEMNRRLLPYHVTEKPANTEEGQLYWLGAFRSFIARTDKRYETTNICLSVTRIDKTKLVLEPNNCSLLLKAVCNNYIVGSEDENMGHTYVHVYVIAAVTIIIAIIVVVGVLFYFYKCRRPKQQKEDQIRTLADTIDNQYDNDYSDINELEMCQKKNNSTKEVNYFVPTQNTYADIEITSNEPTNSEEEEYYHTATNYRLDERTGNKNKPVNVYSKCKDITRSSNVYDTSGHSEKQHPGLAMIDCDTYNTANNAETSNTYNVAGESVLPMGLSPIDSNTYTSTAGIGRP